MSEHPVYSVSDFVAVCNQILDLSFGSVEITGELANFKVSKNRWVYFDLKDDFSSLRFFGTVYNLPGPLEDGMVLTVKGTPQLHPKFGFSVIVRSIQLQGEGTIKKAAKLLEDTLRKEGLFDPNRKRMIPYPPRVVGLITSGESAAYADFIKILNQRWVGVDINHFDVQVQGDGAAPQIVKAIEYFNSHAHAPDVLVIIRGGGSADDLQAFSSEAVTRSVAGSRIPTLVAVGHELDISLAEIAADQRASTPSNAAELLVPDKKQVAAGLVVYRQQTVRGLGMVVEKQRQEINALHLPEQLLEIIRAALRRLVAGKQTAQALDPKAVLQRGYAIVRSRDEVIKTSKLKSGTELKVTFADGSVPVKVT